MVRRLITVSASPQRAAVADSYDRYYGSGVYDAVGSPGTELEFAL